MNRTIQRWVAAIAAGAMVITVAIIGFAAAQADASELTDGTNTTSSARQVTNAEFAWGINAEATGGAYFGGCNFLSAGKAGNTKSARIWTEQDGFFKSSDGKNVSVVKPTSSGSFESVTWANKCQNSDGVGIGGKTTSASDSSSHAQVHIAAGKGWIDTEQKTAQIKWDGSFTVAFYGGMTYWHVSNPLLQVYADGTAKLVASIGGYGTDMDDMSKWEALTPATVELMNFHNATVTQDGIQLPAKYLGVKFDSKLGRNEQTPKTSSNEGWWGSFPISFVEYQLRTGQSSYWYTTAGGAGTIQPRKVAKDLQITGFTLGDPVDASFDDIAIDSGLDNGTKPTPKPNPSPSPSEKPSTGGTKKPGKATSKFAVKNAVLRWGLNDETSSAAFYGGCNYLVAGKVGNVGSARVWSDSDGYYRANSGKVEILKPNAQGTLQRATWANRCQDRNGQNVTTSSRNTTESIVSIKGGKGEIDPKKGTASISWKGSFTVAFYGGMTYWHVSDPVLEVKKNGTGTLKGTAGGFGTDMEDMSKWVALKERTITLANLRKVDVTKKNGLTVTPEYLGVAVKSAGSSHSGQAQKNSVNSSYWGSFPQSFVDFQIETGQSAYWYTSGGSRDWAKPANPITVSYDAANVQDKAKKSSKQDNASNTNGTNTTAPSNPLRTPTRTGVTPPSSLNPTQPGTPGPVAPSGLGQTSVTAWAQQGPATTIVAIDPVELVPVNREQEAISSDTAVTVVWAAIGAGLLAAAVILFIPGSRLAPARARRTKP